jgi:hypothetical protein
LALRKNILKLASSKCNTFEEIKRIYRDLEKYTTGWYDEIHDVEFPRETSELSYDYGTKT